MTSNKNNEKLTVSADKLKGTIKLSGGLTKGDILNKLKLSNDSTRGNLITRRGEAEVQPIQQMPEEAFGLSNNEKQRRLKALEQDTEKEKKKEDIKQAKKKAIEEEALEEFVEIEETKPIEEVKSKIDSQINAASLNVKVDVSSKPNKSSKQEVKEKEAPVITFKQSENLVSIDDIKKAEPQVKVDKRDKSVIEKMMRHYKYLEFDNDSEIESLQKGLELRTALEERRKGLQDGKPQDEDVFIQSSTGDVDEEFVKIKREAYFSRYNKKPSKKNYSAPNFIQKEIEIYDKNIVIDVARELAVKVEDFLRKLKNYGIFVKENDVIDGDAAELVIEEMGHVVKRVKKLTAEDKLTKVINSENLKSVIPVVTVMGHVDHGKTSLLDALRKADVAEGEAGGITQHIGAYQTTLENGKKITFIDTPGHEAFTAIRERGANVTHVVVLVVAADDGVMPQTIEAIKHGKAAAVPMVVAINKIDRPNADVTRVKNELLAQGLVSDDLGGDVIFVPVSAKTGKGLKELCDAILLQSEVLDLKAEYNISASGAVLEGKLDKQKGVVGTLLVQNGTLKIGDIVVVESAYFKVRTMVNDKGESLKQAEPSMPVEVYGMSDVPTPGANFNVVESEKLAKEITAHRKDKKQEALAKTSQIGFGAFLKKGVEKILFNIIIRADVQSTIEAIRHSINGIKIPKELEIKIMQATVGNVSEADVTFAKTYNAVIFSFVSKVGPKEEELAKRLGVTLKQHSIIYKIIDDIKEMLSEKLPPIIKEENIGDVEVRAIFDISKSGKIAGSVVKKGVAKRNAIAKVFRNGVFIAEGKIKTLKHFKEDVKELAQGNECGIQIEGFESFLVADTIQVVERTEEKRVIN